MSSCHLGKCRYVNHSQTKRRVFKGYECRKDDVQGKQITSTEHAVSDLPEVVVCVLGTEQTETEC